MLFKYLKDFSLFFLLFVSFNDFFSTELTGDYIIKVALVLFVVLHVQEYMHMLSSRSSSAMKGFYIFMLILAVVTMATNLFYFNDTFVVGATRMFSIFALFVYFSYTKELDKVLYMLWVIMIFSSIVAYFSAPLDLYTFRKTGATEDPNEFAAQLLVILFVTVYLFQKNKNWFFLLGSLGIFTYTLLFAGSKSAFIFLAMILLLVFVTKFKTIISHIFSGKGLMATIVLAGVLSAGVMMSGTAVEGLKGRAQKSGTLEQRLIVWSAGGEMIRDHFFMGVGFGEFKNVSARYVKDFLAEEARPSHNNFVKIFAESGVFTFLAFTFFIFSLFVTRFTQIVRSDYYWLYLASLSMVLMGLTVPSLHHKDFWIAIAIVSNVIMLFMRKEAEIDTLSRIKEKIN